MSEPVHFIVPDWVALLFAVHLLAIGMVIGWALTQRWAKFYKGLWKQSEADLMRCIEANRKERRGQLACIHGDN